MSSGTTSQVRAASLFLFLLLLLLPPNEHPPPWCAAGDVVVALTISIFTPAGATDAMPPSTGFCLLTASILFLFVALSLPIIKTVYLLQINGHPSPSQPETSIGTELRFGVWGFCVTRSASHHQSCSPFPPFLPSCSLLMFSNSGSRRRLHRVPIATIQCARPADFFW